MSGNRGLNGNQNHKEGGKISTRVLAPPGGGSSFSFSDMGGGPKMSYATSANGRVGNNSSNNRPPMHNHQHDVPQQRRNPSDYDNPLGGTGGRDGYPQKVSPGKTKRRPSLDYGDDALDQHVSRSKQTKGGIPGLEGHYQQQEPVRSTRNNTYYDNGDSAPQQQAYSSRGAAASQSKLSAREYADALRAQIDNKASLRGGRGGDSEETTSNGRLIRRDSYGSDGGYDSGRDSRNNSQQIQQQSTSVSRRGNGNPPGGRSSLQLC
jgi:hypothetical protein